MTPKQRVEEIKQLLKDFDLEGFQTADLKELIAVLDQAKAQFQHQLQTSHIHCS